MSFDEIRTKSIRIAQNLQIRGYKPKQVFGIIAKNSHHVAPGNFCTIFLKYIFTWYFLFSGIWIPCYRMSAQYSRSIFWKNGAHAHAEINKASVNVL